MSNSRQKRAALSVADLSVADREIYDDFTNNFLVDFERIVGNLANTVGPTLAKRAQDHLKAALAMAYKVQVNGMVEAKEKGLKIQEELVNVRICK